jgi:hypothetical protein
VAEVRAAVAWVIDHATEHGGDADVFSWPATTREDT